MRLRNLSITDAEVENRELVIDGVQEVERVIEDNYEETLNREIGIEFNIGSRLGFSKEYLVVYCNPDYKNNPYFRVADAEEEKMMNLCMKAPAVFYVYYGLLWKYRNRKK